MKNGQKQGFWKFYSPTKDLLQTAVFKNDEYYGKVVYFYQNGNKKAEGTIIKDNSTGEYKEWFVNGKISLLGNFKESKKDSLWTFWYQDGQKQHTEYYYPDSVMKIVDVWSIEGDTLVKNGIGYYIDFYENGNILEEGNIIDGMRDSLWKEYFENGKLQSSGYYDNDKKNKKWLTFYPSGNMKSVINYENGKYVPPVISIKLEPGKYWIYPNLKTGKQKATIKIFFK
ncbi:MAG: hypothetical protein U9N34_09450 [Candidatus Cloacimonadota bacterium]|nr:hypothetical protein [Candidatus Cloacimonadota bacterium]